MGVNMAHSVTLSKADVQFSQQARAKFRAFAVHLSLSALAIGLYLGLVFLAWYPYPYFQIENVWDVIHIVVGVDLVLGPLMTFVVFSPGKKTLKFDLSIIALIQFSALLWGMHVTYTQRPVYVAIFDYSFEVVANSEVDTSKLKDPQLRVPWWGGAPKLVYVNLPFTDAEIAALGKKSLAKGKTVSAMAQYYEPFSQHRDELYRRAVDIRKRMREFPGLQSRVDRIVARHGGSLDDYVFMSVEGRQGMGFLVLDKKTGHAVDALVN